MRWQIGRRLLPDHHREVTLRDTIEILVTHLHWQIVVNAEVANLLQEISRVTSPHGTSLRDVVFFDQDIDDIGPVFAVKHVGVNLEELVKLVDFGVFDFDLVRNASQEGLISQRVWFEVR